MTAIGEANSQSRMGSVSGPLSARCGAFVQEVNAAPTACTSARLHGSLSTRTACPRATSRRTTASIGGVLPPPSQCVNRNDRLPATCPSNHVSSDGSALREHAAYEPSEDVLGFAAAVFQVAPQQLTQIHVGRGVERRDPPLALGGSKAREIRRERLGEPRAMQAARSVEHPVDERQRFLLLERTDVQRSDRKR